MDHGVRAEAEKPRCFAVTPSEISNRSPEAATSTVANGDGVRTALLSSGNVLPPSCACSSLLTSVNGTSIGTPTLTRAGRQLRHDFNLRRKRTCRFGFGWHDAGLRIDADQQIDRRRRHARLRRHRARRLDFKPTGSAHPVPATPSGKEWHSLTHSVADGLFQRRIVAYPRLELRDLLAHRAVDQRLDLVRHVELQRRATDMLTSLMLT